MQCCFVLRHRKLRAVVNLQGITFLPCCTFPSQFHHPQGTGAGSAVNCLIALTGDNDRPIFKT